MAPVVLVDASDMKEYVIHLNEENAQRAATDVAYALKLLNAEKARQSSSADENTSAGSDSTSETFVATAPGNKSEYNSFRWYNPKTQLFLQTYMRLKPLYDSGRVPFKKFWQIVAKTLNDDGIPVSGAQCVSKLHTLKRTYRAIKRHKQETGQLKSWPFFKKMEFLMEDENFANRDKNDEGDGDLDEFLEDVELSVDSVESSKEDGALAGEEGEVFRWPHKAIIQLTEEAIKLRPLCESGVITQKKCWERVAEALKRHGHDVSGRQCMSKFQCLRRTYKSINDYNVRVERGEEPARRRMRWIYYDTVGKLLEDSWTCTLNTNCDNQEVDALDLPDVEMNSDSQESNVLNETVEDKIDSNTSAILGSTDETVVATSPGKNAETQTNSPHTFDELGLTMECDEYDADDADSGLTSSVVIAASKTEEKNAAASNEEPKWDDKSTRLLINEFKEKRSLYIGLGKELFTAISESLTKEGFAFNPVQVEDYWRALVHAFRTFGTGKSSSTIRVAPFYTDLRNILGKSIMLDFPKKPAVPRRLAVPSRGGLGAKAPLLTVNIGGLPGSEICLSPVQSPRKTPPSVGITNGANNSGKSSRHKKKNGKRFSLKVDALSILQELLEEISKQNREIQNQSQQREAYCQKIIAQNEVMMKQRERRNELLEELVRLRRKEV